MTLLGRVGEWTILAGDLSMQCSLKCITAQLLLLCGLYSACLAASAPLSESQLNSLILAQGQDVNIRIFEGLVDETPRRIVVMSEANLPKKEINIHGRAVAEEFPFRGVWVGEANNAAVKLASTAFNKTTDTMQLIYATLNGLHTPSLVKESFVSADDEGIAYISPKEQTDASRVNVRLDVGNSDLLQVLTMASYISPFLAFFHDSLPIADDAHFINTSVKLFTGYSLLQLVRSSMINKETSHPLLFPVLHSQYRMRAQLMSKNAITALAFHEDEPQLLMLSDMAIEEFIASELTEEHHFKEVYLWQLDEVVEEA